MAGENTAAMGGASEEDLLRADLYDFLSALLARPPSRELLDRCAALEGDDTDIGKAVGALARLARATTEKAARDEFTALFIGVGRGELLPYASYYMTGFLNEKPLAKLRADMRRYGIEREANVYEPEDNIASLFEMAAGLIRGRFERAVSIAEQREFFNTHLAPWAGHFFADLEAAEGSVFYAPVGSLGRAFIEVEREAYRLEG